MKLEEAAMMLIDFWAGGGASLWGKQLTCSPSMIAQYGHQLKGMGDNISQKSYGYGFTCTTSIQPNHTGQAGTSAVASYTQQTNAMEMINKGLQSLADKVKGVSEFIQKAQTYLRNLLQTFRLKIIKLLGTWLGTLVVAAVAMLAVKLIKSLINKVAGKLGAAGVVVRAVGDKLANEIKTTLTKPKVPEPKVPEPKVGAQTTTTAVPALPPASEDKMKITAQPPETMPTWVAKPAPNGASAKPMPNVFDNSPF